MPSFLLQSALLVTVWSSFISCTALQNSTEAGSLLSDFIIKKYGSNGRTLTLLEFTNLLRNLKIGVVHSNSDISNSCKSNSKTKINEIIHGRLNCTEDEPLSSNPALCNSTSQCLSSSQLLSLLPKANITVDKDVLLQLCPVLLSQIEQGNCLANVLQQEEIRDNKPSHLEEEAHRNKHACSGVFLIYDIPHLFYITLIVYMQVWGYGLLFVTIISLCSLVGVSVLPMMGKKLYNRLLTFLIGLAVGSLSGSAVFHLIPQAFDLIPEDNENHNYLWVSLVIMGGIYMFFMTERFMKILMDARKRKMNSLSRSYSDTETLRYMATISEDYQRSLADSNISLSVNKNTNNHVHPNSPDSNNRLSSSVGHKHEHHIEFKQGQHSAVATVAWMIIFGDGLHNFIDGLSIGAAFSESILTGVSISVAVICEEFPHELGDFAVLLNAGMTMKQALLYNFLSACTCYLGLVVGILLGELTAASTYIFALAAGMFLYISLVDMVPEMNEEAEIASRQGVLQGCKILFLQNLGWLTGVTVLFVLAYFNKDISFE